MSSSLSFLFAVFMILLVLGCPVAAALGISAVGTIFLFQLAPIDLLPHLLLSAVQSFTLLPIPLFILAGGLLAGTRVSRELVLASGRLIGRRRGGLAYVMIVGSIFLAGISGSGPADVAVLGSLMKDPMKEKGFPPAFVAALAAACGGIGIIVPPSIALIIYGVVAETDISALFLAGVIPGAIVGACLAVGTWLSLRVHDFDAAAPMSESGERVATGPEDDPSEAGWFRSRWAGAAWGAGFPLIILGGIYSGVFTPTESAAVAVAYALFVGGWIYHDLSFGRLKGILTESVRTSAGVMAIVATASLFSWVVTTQGMAQDVANALGGFSEHPWLILLLANLTILIAGCFMDAISVFYVFIPLLLPAVRAAGIDSVHFGIITTVNLALGQVTPPIGVNLFVASGVTGQPLSRVIRAVLPLLVALLVALVLVSCFPELSLLIPRLASES
jgi:C4-dicarboxylate transporter DctM subunit